MTEEKVPLPGEVPVFPLPNAILFPGIELPLYVFEPRYREMLADVLEGSKFMAVSLLKPGWEEKKEPCPSFDVVGVGFVKVAVNHTDGTSHIVVKGIGRARIERYVAMLPYRIAEISELSDIEEDTAETESLRQELLSTLRDIKSEIELREIAQDLFEKPAARLADFVTFYSSLSPYEKQALLEEHSVAKRLYALIQGIKK